MFISVTKPNRVATSAEEDEDAFSLASETERAYSITMASGGIGELYGTAPDWMSPSIDEFFGDEDEPDEW